MDKRNIEAIYPLNSMQEALLFHCLQPGPSDAGFLQVRFKIQGPLYQDAFETAWSKAVQRHESMRMSVHVPKTRKPMLIVSKTSEMDFLWKDNRDLSAEKNQEWLESFCQRDRQAGLVLSQSPVSRIMGVRTTEDQYEFVWSCHRLLLDGWSGAILLKEMLDFYQQERTGEHPGLSRPTSHRDYFKWLKSQNTDRTAQFWTDYLEGFSAPALLPRMSAESQQAANSIPKHSKFASDEVEISAKLGSGIEQAAASIQVTSAAIVYAAWTLLLSAISGSQDILFGSTNSGRAVDLPGHESMTGFFSNVVPKRFFVAPQESVSQLVQAIHRDQYASQPYEHFPLIDIQQCSNVSGLQPLIESLLVFENIPWKDIHLPVDGGIKLCEASSKVTTTYPLTLIVLPRPHWSMHYIYDQTLLASDVIRKIMCLVPALLEIISEDTAQLSQTVLDWLDRELPQLKTHPVETNLPPTVSSEAFIAPRNSTELEVAKIWAELLGMTDIDIHADFLSLGGRSIAAVRMLSMIEDRFGKRIALADLIEQPTIAHIASKIDGDIQSRSWKTLVPIQPQGTKKPLFFVHAGGGHVLFLRALVPHLGLDQPIYGLQPSGLDGECPPLSMIEEMATQYLVELQAIQPVGPYYLVGHCLGSVVAFEMSQQLLQRGEQIGMLVVLDTTPPTIGTRRTLAEQSQNNDIPQNETGGRWVAAAKKITAFCFLRWRAQKTRLAKFVKRHWILTFGSSIQKKEFFLQTVRHACMRAFKKYSASPFAGSITLIRTRDAREVHLGWGELTEDFQTLLLSVGHSTIFLEPEVQLLAEALTQLQEATDPVNHVRSRNS